MGIDWIEEAPCDVLASGFMYLAKISGYCSVYLSLLSFSYANRTAILLPRTTFRFGAWMLKMVSFSTCQKASKTIKPQLLFAIFCILFATFSVLLPR